LSVSSHLARVTVFLGCGFAAKYRDGGGNFSVPLQWMLGLRRLKLDAVWLEILPTTGNAHADKRTSTISSGNCAHTDSAVVTACFIKRSRMTRTISMEFVASVFQNANCSIGWPGRTRCSISVIRFIRRFFAVRAADFMRSRSERNLLLDDEDGTGQSHHHEFWTIGLNVHGLIAACRSQG